MGSKMDIFSKVSDDKMLKIYHDMLESNMIGSKSTMQLADTAHIATDVDLQQLGQLIALGEDIRIGQQLGGSAVVVHGLSLIHISEKATPCQKFRSAGRCIFCSVLRYFSGLFAIFPPFLG